MKNTILIPSIAFALVAVLFLAGCSTAQQTTEQSDMKSEPVATPVVEGLPSSGVFTLDTSASTLSYEGFGVGKSHKGSVPISEGSLDASTKTGSFIIDMTGMTAENDRLLGHLKSADFFDVENYPTSSFKITDISESMVVTGDLTILGKTDQISFPAEVSKEGDSYRVTASFDIDRTKWGIVFRSGSIFDDLGDSLIKDDIKYDLDLVFQ